jgi:hypothetical protein
LSGPAAFAPAAPAREPAESLAGWLELIESVAPSRPEPAPAATRVSVIARGDEALRRAHRLAEQARSVEVDVVSAESRRAGLESVDADWVVFLDDEDTPDDGILEAFVAAQAAANADVVTAAVRPADDPRAAQLFLGDPGALGLVENQYGVLGMVRRSAVAHLTHDGGIDPDWPLFARLALAGARVVSIPDTLSEHRGRPGTVGDVPGDGLAVLAAFEEREAGPLRDLPELAATLGASLAGVELRRSADHASAGALERILRILRSEGVAGVARRARRRAAGGVE